MLNDDLSSGGVSTIVDEARGDGEDKSWLFLET